MIGGEGRVAGGGCLERSLGTRFTSSTKSVPSPGFCPSYQRASRSMSALASGCLLGAFIQELALEILEMVRFEWNRNGRIGPEFRKAALQFGDKFRRFVPFRLGCDIRPRTKVRRARRFTSWASTYLWVGSGASEAFRARASQSS